MIQIRHNLFETNSSSTHSLVIATKEDWNKFKNGEMFLNMYEDTLNPITPETNVPKQTTNGKWEFKGKMYNDLYDIDDYMWYNRSRLIYEAFNEMCVENIEKDLGDGRVAISMYAHED